MEAKLIFWPVLVQISLVIFLYLRLAAVKAREVKAGNVDLKETALNQEAWPKSVRKINNNLRNQFETPILFFVLCLSLAAVGGSDLISAALASAYVGLRIAHAYVHTSSNRVSIRMPLFIASFLPLAALMVQLAMALVVGS